MADWKNIPDAAVDPDAPVTSDLMYSLRDNPVAIAEGSAGAPKVQGQALENVFLATLSSPGPTPIGVVGIPRARVFFVRCMVLDTRSSSNYIQARYTTNGSSWSGWQDVIPLTKKAGTDNGTYDLEFNVNLNGGSFVVLGRETLIKANEASSFSIMSNTGTHTIPSGAQGIQIRSNLASGIVASFYCFGGMP